MTAQLGTDYGKHDQAGTGIFPSRTMSKPNPDSIQPPTLLSTTNSFLRYKELGHYLLLPSSEVTHA